MPYLKRERRTRIYYEVHGSGTPLLLTHGYSSASGMWQGQIEPFTKAGYKLIIWDMRGHGRSAYPDDQSVYSEAYTVEDMEALLDHVCGPNTSAVVGGLSLGGYMSQAFYRDHPQRVESLLIIGMASVVACIRRTDPLKILARASKVTRRENRGTSLLERQPTSLIAKVSVRCKT